MLYSDVLENKSDMQKSLCECRGIFLLLQHWILRKNLLECVESDACINVINLKRPLNGKQNVWKYQNGEEKSDSDGREKDV